MNTKFYYCDICGLVIEKLNNVKGHLVCCGKPMQELVPNKTDAAVEKHVPEVKTEGTKVEVCVGSTLHPMESDHLIQFIYLETNIGGKIKKLSAGDEPKAVFALADGEKATAVYAYCDKHSLWVKEL